MHLRIKELREENDYNQEYIAHILNIGQTTYSRYESGHYKIPIDSLSVLADFYGVSADYVMGRTDEKQPYPKPKQWS